VSVLKKGDFSKEQCSSLKMILGSKHFGAILNVLQGGSNITGTDCV